jgi:hypothetical protein
MILGGRVGKDEKRRGDGFIKILNLVALLCLG